MKTAPYQTVALICSIIFTALCLTLLFLPGLIYWLFDLAESPAATVLAKRAGILFLGLSALLFLTRQDAANPTRHSVQSAVALMLGAMAVLGGLEWLRGTVGNGIWVAIVVEVVLALALITAR